ncbi:hypothetical protein CDL15_Pgr013166 [Punica granatum]|nr:hypothetical protein CDL15_Pgr013166 [Punica granatum]
MEEIVIVGGGLSGLATALALHRKGIASLVLERSESLRASGAAITIRTNGWHALDYLGIASALRQTAVSIEGFASINLDWSMQQTRSPISRGETRCIRRSDLIEALARDLPPGSIRFGSYVKFIKSDPFSSCPILHLNDGSTIKAKALVGCDGVNSVVLDYLGMRPTNFSGSSAFRGFTNYPEGHGFENLFFLATRGKVLLGRVPVDDTLVYWFITRHWTPEDLKISNNQDLMKSSSLESIKDFPEDVTKMIEKCDRSSLSCMRFRYRAPWDLMVESYRKGTTTVAGDALHAMSPFIGQGGSASLEDAIVLTEFLAQKLREVGPDRPHQELMGKYEEALEGYVKHRRMRLVRLSAQSYLMTKLAETSSVLVKTLCIAVMIIFFRDYTAHTEYDCRRLRL